MKTKAELQEQMDIVWKILTDYVTGKTKLSMPEFIQYMDDAKAINSAIVAREQYDLMDEVVAIV